MQEIWLHRLPYVRQPSVPIVLTLNRSSVATALSLPSMSVISDEYASRHCKWALRKRGRIVPASRPACYLMQDGILASQWAQSELEPHWSVSQGWWLPKLTAVSFSKSGMKVSNSGQPPFSKQKQKNPVRILFAYKNIFNKKKSIYISYIKLQIFSSALLN